MVTVGRPRRHGSGRLLATVGVVLMATAATVAGAVTPASAGALLLPMSETNLLDVACWSPGACVVVGGSPANESAGAVIPVLGGVPGTVELVPGLPAGVLEDVSCSGPSCVAVAFGVTAGYGIVDIVDGAPGSFVPLAGASFYSVACASPSWCVVVGGSSSNPGEGVAVPVVGGVPQAPIDFPGTNYLWDVACAAAGDCVAVANTWPDASVVSLTDGTQGPAVAIPGGGEYATVSCGAPGSCLATGESSSDGTSAVVPIVDGVPGTPVDLPLGTRLSGASCWDASHCLGVGTGDVSGATTGIVVPVTDGVLGAPEPEEGTEWLSGVSCPDASACVAVGIASDASEGMLLTSLVGGPGDIGITSAGPTQVVLGASGSALVPYTLTVSNPGTAASGVVVVSDVVTDEVAGSASCGRVPACRVLEQRAASGGAATVVWSIDSVAAGASGLALNVEAAPTTAGSLTNEARWIGGGCATLGQCSTGAVVTQVAAAPVPPTTVPPTVPLVTNAHTGEPWAGSGPLAVALFALGVALVAVGTRRRRSLRGVPGPPTPG